MPTKQIKQKLTVAYRRVFGNDSEKKIFAIGFNKTGTTSLDHVFQTLGLISYHGTEWRSCDDIQLLQVYDCFSDGIPEDLEKLDKLFPESRFILQVRDLNGWLLSRLSHIERRQKVDAGYGSSYWEISDSAIKCWIKQRQEYHQMVLKYFAERPDDLLVVNFTRDKNAATKVCNFLGYTGEFDRPEKNIHTTLDVVPEHQKLIDACARQLRIPPEEMQFDTLCPSLADVALTFPPDTAIFPNNATRVQNSRLKKDSVVDKSIS